MNGGKCRNMIYHWRIRQLSKNQYSHLIEHWFAIESYHAAIRTAALVKNEDPPEIADETSLEI